MLIECEGKGMEGGMRREKGDTYKGVCMYR